MSQGQGYGGDLAQLCGSPYANAQASASLQQQPPPKPAAKIRARIAELEKVRANYVGYLEFRKSEADWHGCWDASVNISETECEIAGLKFALNALEAG